MQNIQKYETYTPNISVWSMPREVMPQTVGFFIWKFVVIFKCISHKSYATGGNFFKHFSFISSRKYIKQKMLLTLIFLEYICDTIHQMRTTLVESSLPPSPTSIMAASTYEWDSIKWNISSEKNSGEKEE